MQTLSDCKDGQSGSIASYLELYRLIARIRHAELCIAAHYPEQRMRCPVHLSIGQEGVAAGLAMSMRSGDKLYAAHRSHAAYLASGGALQPFFAELLGREGGICGGRGGSMHLMNATTNFLGAVPILGDAVALATGCALAMQMRGENLVTAVMFGDGATEEGSFQESLQFAASKKLPIVYVCENNGLSVNTPWGKRRQESFRLTAVASAFGLNATSGDGNDPVAVMQLCQAAIERARNGTGPFFLEFFTWRWQEHCGPREEMFPLIKDGQTFFPWQKSCPLQNLRKHQVLSRVESRLLADIEEEERNAVSCAWQLAESASFVAASAAAHHVYASSEGRSGN